MARRQQLLGQLEEPRGRRKPPSAPPDPSPRYPPEVKAKAYAAYLDGAGWSDCARAIGHPDPNGSGSRVIQQWAENDHWKRLPGAGDYKAKVEKERDADPQRISDEVDDLCVKMQKVSETYIEQFFEEDEETGEKKIVITNQFKTRDFADMAAALRMIHETRIKIRKANEPKDGDKDGKKTDFLSVIREAGLNRLKENRRRASAAPVIEEDDDADEPDPPSSTTTTAGPPAPLPSLADIRARVEAAAGERGGEAQPVAADPGADGQ